MRSFPAPAPAPANPDTELNRLWVVDGLRELARRKVLFGVWVDGWEIRIKRAMWDERERLFWNHAEDMVISHLIQRVRKPVQSAEAPVTSPKQLDERIA